jgi:hypothetical protein
VTDLRKRRRLCLRILMISPGVAVDSPNPLSTACRELHFPRYHKLMTVLQSGDDGSNDWIEREVESGGVIRVPDYEHIARSRLRVDIGMAASVKGFRMPARRRRKGLHGGRRPKSLEGGNRGGVRDGGGVGLWGICRRCVI